MGKLISAAYGTEKLSFMLSSSNSNTAELIPSTNYDVLTGNFQAIMATSAKIACLIISKKLDANKKYALRKINI